MDDSKGYSRFKLAFHSLILIFAVGLIIVSIAGWNEMNRALLYLVLGIAFLGESIFGLNKIFRHRKAILHIRARLLNKRLHPYRTIGSFN